MRVLLDESLPRQLARELAEHDVRTVPEQGWAGLRNSELLRRAVEEGFEVFLTADQNLEYQQNLQSLGLAVVVVMSRTNRWLICTLWYPGSFGRFRSRRGEVVRVGK